MHKIQLDSEALSTTSFIVTQFFAVITFSAAAISFTFEFQKRLLAYRRLPVRGLRTTCVNQLIINRRDAQNHVVSRLPACPPASQPLQMLLCSSTKH